MTAICTSVTCRSRRLYTSNDEKSWYFRPGDSLLVDRDGSGRFENNLFQSEACPFGPILYLGGKAYKVALAPDCKSLRVEPWSETLAELALQPHGDQVKQVTLAWEGPSGKWQLIRPDVTGGKVMVPPGNYRLYACNLVGGRHLARPGNGLRHAAQPANARERRRRQSQHTGLRRADSDQGHGHQDEGFNVWAAHRGFRQRNGQFGAHVCVLTRMSPASGGEMYSTFYKGDRFQSKPPKPTFSIVAGWG